MEHDKKGESGDDRPVKAKCCCGPFSRRPAIVFFHLIKELLHNYLQEVRKTPEISDSGNTDCETVHETGPVDNPYKDGELSIFATP